jgi:hypothetical protein
LISGLHFEETLPTLATIQTQFEGGEEGRGRRSIYLLLNCWRHLQYQQQCYKLVIKTPAYSSPVYIQS